MATSERYRVVGYDPRHHASAVWLAAERDTTDRADSAVEFDGYIAAEREAAQLVTDHHDGLLWMPVPASVDDLADVQSDRRKPWRD